MDTNSVPIQPVIVPDIDKGMYAFFENGFLFFYYDPEGGYLVDEVWIHEGNTTCEFARIAEVPNTQDWYFLKKGAERG